VTDDELRAMVRDSIARQARPSTSSGRAVDFEPPTSLGLSLSRAANASFMQLPLARGGDGDGACLIEPAVRCNHCGYCLSYGH
jgi:hypothetical protein